jgi:hypothetical protein
MSSHDKIYIVTIILISIFAMLGIWKLATSSHTDEVLVPNRTYVTRVSSVQYGRKIPAQSVYFEVLPNGSIDKEVDRSAATTPQPIEAGFYRTLNNQDEEAGIASVHEDGRVTWAEIQPPDS